MFDIGHGYGRAFGVEKINIRQNSICEDDLSNINLQDVAVLEENLVSGNLNFKRLDVLDIEKIPNGEKFKVKVYEPSLLVRSETWAPGWNAYVNGEKIAVIKVDCALQGIWLGQGDSEVEFIYEPLGYSIGKWVSIITVSILFSIIVMVFVRRKTYDD